MQQKQWLPYDIFWAGRGEDRVEAAALFPPTLEGYYRPPLSVDTASWGTPHTHSGHPRRRGSGSGTAADAGSGRENSTSLSYLRHRLRPQPAAAADGGGGGSSSDSDSYSGSDIEVDMPSGPGDGLVGSPHLGDSSDSSKSERSEEFLRHRLRLQPPMPNSQQMPDAPQPGKLTAAMLAAADAAARAQLNSPATKAAAAAGASPATGSQRVRDYLSVDGSVDAKDSSGIGADSDAGISEVASLAGASPPAGDSPAAGSDDPHGSRRFRRRSTESLEGMSLRCVKPKQSALHVLSGTPTMRTAVLW